MARRSDAVSSGVGAGQAARAIGTVGKQAVAVLYVLALIAVVVGVDVLVFRHHFWARLAANVGIVLVVAAFYLRFPGCTRGRVRPAP